MLKNLKFSLPLLASALAGKQGVKVLQGDWAKTDCKETIWLPPLPEGDPNVTVKALGFVGHETAHIAFTDTSFAHEIKQQPNMDTFFGIQNLLEDIRIEILQKRRFPGVSDNLDKLFKILIDEGNYGASEETEHPNKIMQNWMRNKLRFEVLNQTVFEEIDRQTDEVFKKIIPKNTQIRLEGLAFDVVNAESTRDVFNLTKQIMKMLEEEAAKEKEEEDKAEQAKQDQQAQQDSKSDQDGDSDSSQSGDTQDDDGDSSGNSSADDKSSDGDDSGSDADGQADSNVGNGSSEQDKKMSDVLKDILGAGHGDQYEDVGDVLAKEINQIKVKAASNSGAEGNDGGPLRVFNAKKQDSKGRNHAYDFEARRAVNALKQKLHVTLQAMTMGSVTRSHSGSRFTSRHLHEIKTGGKVFVKRTEGIDIDIAAALLIDISVSMNHDNRIKLATLAGYATAEALASVHGVRSAVAVFPTPTGVDYISPFGAKPVVNAQNFATLSTNGNTPLSDAMSRVSIDLLQQPQARKILLVVTDGDPNHNDQSKTVIEAATRAGVEVMGVGIGVKLDNLFKTWCTIDSIQDLPTEMFRMLQNGMTIKLAA